MHRPTREQCHTAMQKVPNRNVRGFGWEMAHDAVSRRPPIPLYTMVARTHMYTYDANVWDLSIVQGAFSVAAKLQCYDSQLFASLYVSGGFSPPRAPPPPPPPPLPPPPPPLPPPTNGSRLEESLS
jgi:hypothetical protein